MKKLAMLFVAAVALAIGAQGQTVQSYGDGPDCAAQKDVVKQILSELNVKQGNGFVWNAACTEQSWFKLTLEYRMLVKTNTGFTDFRYHGVYIRTARRSYSDIRDTVAHELGHIICECSSEQTAHDIGDRLVKQVVAVR